MMKIFSFFRSLARSSLVMQNWKKKINMKRFHKSCAHFSVFSGRQATNKVCLPLRHLVFTSCLTNDFINILINYGKYLRSSSSSCPRELLASGVCCCGTRLMNHIRSEQHTCGGFKKCDKENLASLRAVYLFHIILYSHRCSFPFIIHAVHYVEF